MQTTNTKKAGERTQESKPYIRLEVLSSLEETRDLLCAFHRDHPSDYQPQTSDALRTGLAVIERAKTCDITAVQLLHEWMKFGECFCNSELITTRGRCEFCRTQEFLASI